MKERSRSYVTEEQGKKRQRDAVIGNYIHQPTINSAKIQLYDFKYLELVGLPSASANRHASASACFGRNATALLPHCANTSARRLAAPALTNIGERGLSPSDKGASEMRRMCYHCRFSEALYLCFLHPTLRVGFLATSRLRRYCTASTKIGLIIRSYNRR